MFRCKCYARFCTATWQFIQGAWVPVITSCNQKSVQPALLAKGNFGSAFSDDFFI